MNFRKSKDENDVATELAVVRLCIAALFGMAIAAIIAVVLS